MPPVERRLHSGQPTKPLPPPRLYSRSLPSIRWSPLEQENFPTDEPVLSSARYPTQWASMAR